METQSVNLIIIRNNILNELEKFEFGEDDYAQF